MGSNKNRGLKFSDLHVEKLQTESWERWQLEEPQVSIREEDEGSDESDFGVPTNYAKSRFLPDLFIISSLPPSSLTASFPLYAQKLRRRRTGSFKRRGTPPLALVSSHCEFIGCCSCLRKPLLRRSQIHSRGAP